MDIFSFLTLFGGLAFFLYGMNVISSGLEKLAGGKLEVILQKLLQTNGKVCCSGSALLPPCSLPQRLRSCWLVWSTPALCSLDKPLAFSWALTLVQP